MAKLYTSSQPLNNFKLNPKKETIKFLLDYSKSLCVIETGNYSFDIIKN